MGEWQCPHCGHTITGFERAEFEAKQHELECLHAEIDRLRAELARAREALTKITELETRIGNPAYAAFEAHRVARDALRAAAQKEIAG